MPSIAGQIQLSDFPLPTRKPVGDSGDFTGAMAVDAIVNARRMQNTKPGATVQTLADAIVMASLFMQVGELVTWREYYSDKNQGGNTAVLLDAGSSGARPNEDLGQIFHVGAAGLYLFATFPGVATVFHWGARGDYDPGTQTGTDDVEAIENATASGRRIDWRGEHKFKISRGIILQTGALWRGDYQCEIYPDFATAGEIMIKNQSPISDVDLQGVTVCRIGNNAEHGVIVDQVTRGKFKLTIKADGSAPGGAIGVSPFYPRCKPSHDVDVDCTVDYGGNFGIQVGNLRLGTISGKITNTQRECVGLEPYAQGRSLVNSVSSNIINYPSHGMITADPVLYSAQGNTVMGGLQNGRFYFAIIIDANNIYLADSERDAYDGNAIAITYTSGTHAFYRAGLCEDVTVSDSLQINTTDLPSAGSLTGSIIATGTSGGYHRNCVIGSVKSTLNNPTSGTQNISLVGCANITLNNPVVTGADTDGISARQGTVNAISDSTGTITPSPALTLKPKNCKINNPDIRHFKSIGINIVDGEVVISGGKISSTSPGAIGLNITPSAEALGSVAHQLLVTTPNGQPFSANNIVNCVDGKLSRTKYLKRLGQGAVYVSVNLTSESGVVGTFSDIDGGGNNYSGLVHITAKNTDTASTETTSYILNVVKRASSLDGTLETMSQVGLTTGGGASHPSFTWTIDASNNLIATPISNTNANKSWHFYISTLGDIRIE